MNKIKGLLLGIATLVVIYILDQQNIVIIRNIGLITLASLVMEWFKNSHSSEALIDLLFATVTTLLTLGVQHFLAPYIPLELQSLYYFITSDYVLFFLPGIITVLLAYFLSTPITKKLDKKE